MASEGTSKVNESRSKGKGRTKRTWIASEDDALVDSLGELVVSGNWKCDTGFKTGYLNALEKLMEEKVPGCGLMAVPHIESRVKTLKKQALAINEMLTTSSGFSWDDMKKKVVCEKSVYNGWILAHKDAAGLYDKAFPHLDELVDIYAKDRANGMGATCPADELEEIEAERQAETIADSESVYASSDHTQNVPPSSGEQSTRVKKKTRLTPLDVGSGLNLLANSMRTFLKDHTSNLKEFCSVMARDNERDKDAMVFEELGKISGLDRDNRIEASTIILGCPTKTRVFLGMPVEDREYYVRHIILKLPR